MTSGDFLGVIVVILTLFGLSSVPALDGESIEYIDTEETCLVRTIAVNYHWLRFKDKEVTKTVYCVSDVRPEHTE